jgi:thiamine-phosphate pyrophosphorylase
MPKQFDLSVYLVTDRGLCRGRDLMETILAAVRGGVTLVQLREKQSETRDFVDLARELVKRLTPLGVALIINDRVDVAAASGAAGVHLGQTDMHPNDARTILGPDAIIGQSVDTVNEALAAEGLPVDYLGVGPVYATTTKDDAGPVLGPGGLVEFAERCKLPFVGIGGIGLDNAGPVIAAGAHGVAVVSAICAADEPETAARILARTVTIARG